MHSLLMLLEQKNLPRKKRRKLEAAREMLEYENQSEKLEVRPSYTSVCFTCICICVYVTYSITHSYMITYVNIFLCDMLLLYQMLS